MSNRSFRSEAEYKKLLESIDAALKRAKEATKKNAKDILEDVPSSRQDQDGKDASDCSLVEAAPSNADLDDCQKEDDLDHFLTAQRQESMNQQKAESLRTQDRASTDASSPITAICAEGGGDGSKTESVAEDDIPEDGIPEAQALAVPTAPAAPPRGKSAKMEMEAFK